MEENGWEVKEIVVPPLIEVRIHDVLENREENRRFDEELRQKILDVKPKKGKKLIVK